MKSSIRSVYLLFACALAGFSSTKSQAQTDLHPLEVVDYVDLERYLGKWYEVASIPQSFQEGCVNSSAEYSKMRRNRIRVINTCEVDGRTKRARGKAWVVDNETNAKLKVQFFWPFKGDYWIIELDEDYQYAVVGDPNRNSLWILSRTPRISDDLFDDLLNRIEFTHLYDPSEIVRASESLKIVN